MLNWSNLLIICFQHSLRYTLQYLLIYLIKKQINYQRFMRCALTLIVLRQFVFNFLKLSRQQNIYRLCVYVYRSSTHSLIRFISVIFKYPVITIRLKPPTFGLLIYGLLVKMKQTLPCEKNAYNKVVFFNNYANIRATCSRKDHQSFFLLLV